MIRKTTAILAPALAMALPATALEFKPSLSLDKRGRYETQQVTAKSTWGQSADFVLVPAFFKDRHAILPVLAELEQGRGLEIEETFFVRRTTYLLKPMYRYQGEGGRAYKGWLTAKRTVNAEKDDVAPYKGLYDYEEYAAGAGMDLKLEGPAEGLDLGLELQHRHYMNWRELGPQLTGDKNYYTKDYNGMRASADLKGPKDGRLGWGLGLSWLGRFYTDNYLYDVAPNGQVQGSVTPSKNPLRAEHFWRAALDAGYALAPGWSLAADLGFDWNVSNMNHFDFAFNQGTADFYGYHSTGGGLRLAWLPWGPEGTRFSFRAGLLNRVYTGRPIRHANGTYTEGKQADVEQDLRFDLDAPIGANFSVVGGASWLNVLSNQSLEAGVRNTYDLFGATLGLRYRI